MSDPDLSIIIVSWNTKVLLQKCLESIYRQQKVIFEIIVIDNASTDDSVQFIKTNFPDILCILNKTNLGFATANNQGIDKARGKHILLCNPDIEFLEPNSLATFIAYQKTSHAAIVGCKLLYANGLLQPSVREFPTFFSQFLIALKLHLIFPKIKFLKKYYCADFNYDKTQKVCQVSGACFLISNECIQQIGKLDEHFWIWFEEVDYCKRVYMAGFEIQYFAQIAVTHHGGQSFQQVLPVKRQTAYLKSLLQYAKKYYLWWQYVILILIFPVSICFGLITPSRVRQHSYAETRKP